MAAPDDDLLGNALDALLAGRATRRDAFDAALWREIERAGHDRALVPEAAGGAALGLRDVAGAFTALGRHAAAVPLGEAIVARALAAAAGAALPDGPVSLGLGRRANGVLAADAVPWAADATAVVVAVGGGVVVAPVAQAQVTSHPGIAAAGECDLRWSDPGGLSPLPEGVDAALLGAALRCAQIAGALDAALALSLRHAAERQQFGRALAQFQAIQQQLALLAEDLAAARMAAAMACDADGLAPHRHAVEAAKLVAGEAAARGVAIAHAVHGAIGMTAEHALQRFTRRLQGWRLQFGGEARQASALGAAWLADRRPAWDFVRAPQGR
jgi:acyl-CoA dehydrogenase